MNFSKNWDIMKKYTIKKFRDANAVSLKNAKKIDDICLWKQENDNNFILGFKYLNSNNAYNIFKENKNVRNKI